MKKIFFIIILASFVSCSTFHKKQSGFFQTKDGNKIEFKNATIWHYKNKWIILDQNSEHVIYSKDVKLYHIKAI